MRVRLMKIARRVVLDGESEREEQYSAPSVTVDGDYIL
jgi:hypothetical protein